MVYTSSKFESKKAARGQVKHLQIRQRLTLGHRNCSNDDLKYVSGLQHEQTLWQARAVPLQSS